MKLAATAAALAAFVLVYLLAGFVAWDWNPAAWPIGGRFYMVLTGMPCAVAAAAIWGTK